ncbi:MAG TPA: hypothetical protein VFG86_16980 [Chloroflexota bacterium]|nr:hypothetical protein [Chloroflexota bacterium]
MAPDSQTAARHVLRLSLTPAQALVGHTTTLRWQVAGHGVRVMGVQLASSNASGICMIESAAMTGSRQLIFTCAGTFTFTLTATFGDGARRHKHVRVGVL